MKKLIEFFIERSLLVNLLSVIIVLVGVLSAIMLKKDTFPEVDFDVIVVSTYYPGSTPEDVEKLITIELERQVKEVDGIEELNALSFEGRSVLNITVDPDYDGDKVLQDVKDAVDSVTDLPEDATDPTVVKAKNTQRSVLKIAITGANEKLSRKVSKDLRDELEQINGVAKVELNGYREEEVVVEVNLNKLNQYQITIGELATAIQARNLNLPGGKLETGSVEYLIRTKGEFESEDDIRNVVIRSNNTGENVKISQVATVTRALNSSAIVQRAQKENAIFVNVKKKFTADILKVTDKAKDKVVKFFEKQDKEQVGYFYVDDLSYFVKRRLGVLTENGLFGLILVFFTLLCFLNFRISVITSLGAPIAFLTAFMFMDALGVSINLISMFGLILVLGMLVDDSIIVSEAFYQHLEKGMKPKDAALKASYETVKPVTATIVTTMLAFGSIFFMGGIMGKFLWPVPAVVIICLLASWLECFFVLPSHLADFVKLSPKSAEKKKWYEPLRQRYEKFLTFCLKHYAITIFVFIAALIGSLVMAKGMRFELFPGDDVREVVINLKGKVGDPLDKTMAKAKEIETAVYAKMDKKEIKALRTIVGTSWSKNSSSRTGSHYAVFILYLTDPTERERSTDDILASVKPEFDRIKGDYEVSSEKLQGGPPTGKPIEVVIKGENLAELKYLAEETLKEVKALSGSVNPEMDYEDGKTQIIIDVNNAEAKRLGLSTTSVAQAVRRAFAEDSLTEIRESDDDIEVVLKLQKESRGDITSLENLYILNNQGRRIQLSRVAKLKEEVGAFIIRRLDRKRTISVYSDINKEKTTPVAAADELRPKLEKLFAAYPTAKFELGGENKDTAESMVRLAKAASIALGAIFLVLVAMFSSLGQPIVILSAIPLGLIGVIITFKILGLALGFMAMMGVIGLVGVVVNDSIVLVNFINLKREEGFEIVNAIIEAGKSRFRPIILTTFTTVAGLLPIAHAEGGDPFLKPMAISFAWGLLFSTFVTLFFIPCCYLTYDRMLTLPEKIGNLKNWILRKSGKVDNQPVQS